MSDALVRTLIRGSLRRARNESIACLFVFVCFGLRLPHLRVGSERFIGCVVILASTLFIAAVVWKFTLSEKLLEQHPEGDRAFWRGTLLRQARLLRLVPLWYLLPLAVGMALYSGPLVRTNSTPFLLNLSLVVVLFISIAWLNLRAAAKIEQQAKTFSG